MKLNVNVHKQSVYFYINSLLLAFFCFCFLYVIAVCSLNIQIQCDYQTYYHRKCVSCGLTRGIFSCIEFDFIKGKKYNKRSEFYFFQGIIQVTLRLTILYIKKSIEHLMNMTAFIFIDVTVSVIVLFILKYLLL